MAAQPIVRVVTVSGLLLLWCFLPPTRAAWAQSTTSAAGFYSEEQATRGRSLFDRHCAACHSAQSAGDPPIDATGRGFRVGLEARYYTSLASPYLEHTFRDRPVFPSVYFLFKRIESQPPIDVDSISAQERADIVAFILRANGLPAGPGDLTPDVASMRAMLLHEEGFEPLFNGTDFTGMQFLLGPNCRPAPEGCGTTDPGHIFTVRDGLLICSGKTHGYWYSQNTYLEFTLRFDYRFDVEWPDDEDLFVGNSGTILFVTDHVVWPKGIEIDGAHRTNLQVNGLATRVRATEDDAARQRARRPIGEWQSVEIVARHGEIQSSLNGVHVSTVHEHEFTMPGSIAFQSQGVPIQWRNVRIKPE